MKDAGAHAEPRDYPVVNDLVKEVAGSPNWRRPLLLIVGGASPGKSMRGGSVLQKVAGALELLKKEFLEVTVEEDGHLDLARFDMQAHGGVLLDGVADALLLKKFRGGPREAIVATVDLSADNLHLLHTDHWPSEPRNVKAPRLTGPSWQNGDDDAAAAQQAPSRHDEMKAWSAKTVLRAKGDFSAGA
ncbi:unnamed protein product [Prorocentrum cordatum]|uniref:Uncharacterized protein n=1 Tax=Prorocentrum cordatum TaxID=2364126 RepID=A0ABN9S358_9DINO|nr:unnamed protein product [Polarella glacialis]